MAFFPLHRSAQIALQHTITSHWSAKALLNPTTQLSLTSYQVPTYTPGWRCANENKIPYSRTWVP